MSLVVDAHFVALLLAWVVEYSSSRGFAARALKGGKPSCSCCCESLLLRELHAHTYLRPEPLLFGLINENDGLLQSRSEYVAYVASLRWWLLL